MSKSVDPNVHGWERAASVAGGLLLLGKGVRKGGIGGLLRLAIGGMAVARGLSGRCAAKRAIADALNERDTARPLASRNAAAATQGTTVAGHDAPVAVVPPPTPQQPKPVA